MSVEVPPFPDAPSRYIAAADTTPIAVFSAGTGPPLVLVHGTTADHRTWRVLAPRLAGRRLHAVDRRGRGDSGDAGDGRPWSIEREFEDLAAVVDAVAAETGAPVDVIGHSLGGRIGLGASLLTPRLGRLVVYEGAPPAPSPEPGDRRAATDELLRRLRAHLEAGDHEAVLATFMSDAVRMPPGDLARFRADPVWPLRVAAAPTILRELEAAERAPAASLDALAAVRVPVLQVVGSATGGPFRRDAEALHERLADGRLVVIEGAGHGGTHSHPAELVAAIEAFLDA